VKLKRNKILNHQLLCKYKPASPRSYPNYLYRFIITKNSHIQFRAIISQLNHNYATTHSNSSYHLKLKMRFTTFSLLCLVSNAIAAPIATDSTTSNIERSMRNVIQSLDGLTDALKSINPRMSSEDVISRWPRVEKACHDVSDLLSTDARNIRMGQKIAVTDSTNLLQPIDQMSQATQRTVDQWIAIKPAINARDRKGVVGTLKHHENTANEYADAIMSVQSTLSQPAGKFFGSRVTTQIEKAISAYS
jgi:hypothetical protein